ncbi:hypothetical protein CRG98_010108 [Punica granatum]|uniref:Uncharacterized protein n=1 Tax=Punica granatum TaxID=22663 RepID=A0A2I0KLY5_PUNGR|nr:hypothetical protein CRG98_010108 [Punica granatum]
MGTGCFCFDPVAYKKLPDYVRGGAAVCFFGVSPSFFLDGPSILPSLTPISNFFPASIRSEKEEGWWSLVGEAHLGLWSLEGKRFCSGSRDLCDRDWRNRRWWNGVNWRLSGYGERRQRKGRCVGRTSEYAIDAGDDITCVSCGRECAGIGDASCSEITGCCSSAILPRARVGYRCGASC